MTDEPSPAVLRFDVVTLFPELFDAPLRTSVIGRAVERGILSVAVHDLREHGIGRHRVVDDAPYGGGAGRVVREVSSCSQSVVKNCAWRHKRKKW